MIERQGLFLLILLQRPEALQIFAESVDLALELGQQRGGFFHGLVLHLDFANQFAQFTLESQRSASGFLAAADRMTVITDAVRQQEEGVRMVDRKPLRSGPIAGEITARKPRQQVGRSRRESVGETKMVTQPPHHAIGASQL